MALRGTRSLKNPVLSDNQKKYDILTFFIIIYVHWRCTIHTHTHTHIQKSRHFMPLTATENFNQESHIHWFVVMKERYRQTETQIDKQRDRKKGRYTESISVFRKANITLWKS